ncbi:PP2C family protein-serine/threonine phosphatase [Corynebacterium comes]|uniref:PP2C-family Ser/Thr phosphatase n=1 Tax=Corynebacterium comes TaxID=2675218 RepID=A0A6B8VTL8_9CORY|nr:protein phosphatase 2C domain-containing protein [Corynebacterium comes]QGU03331.1 PP2C-family Ser/Thr phosphatase [Corynebacterium comes]
MNLRLNYAVLSDRGLVRGNNEDSAYAGPNLLVIADGMGGHAAGEVASQMMVTHLERLDADPGVNDMLALLGSVADDANREIAEEIRQNPETDGMGTTLTALMFNGREFGLIHVGDSRGYLLRDGELSQITIDDTFVQSLVNEGRLDPEDVSSHPQKSLILKAYTGRPVEPTLANLEARPGDRILLCSDGLSDPVTASTIATELNVGSPQVAASRLVELALRSGGPDNITIVVADVVDTSELDEAAVAALPTTAVTAGALLGESEEETHPDTAAGRAALLSRRPKTISPDGEVSRQPLAGARQVPSGAQEVTVGAADDAARSGRFRLTTLILTLLVLIGLVGAVWWVYSTVDRSYFIDTGEEDHLVIESGVNFSVFGRDLHTPYQEACLDEAGALRLVDVGSTEDCSPFTLQDLPESARTSVAGLGTGSYDEVTQQLRRLADQALPLCIARENPPEGENPDSAGGDLTRPGVNCREVR